MRSYGRIRDLEAMVPKQWWTTVFDELYLKTDGDVVEDPDITREEVSLLTRDADIRSLLLRSQVTDVKVLDLCCGQGRHILHLAKEYPRLALHGHDQSSYLINLAKQRASDLNMQKRTVFTVGDCRSIPYADGTFDLVLVMGNSFGYFASDDGDESVLREIFRVLNPGGRLILDLTDGNHMRQNFAHRSWEWIDDRTFACRERQLSKDGLRLISREVITDTEKGVMRDQFYQERLYTRLELRDILSNAGLEMVATGNDDDSGFQDVEVITSAKDLGKRNEDLGMMEQRMLVKAVKINRNKSKDSKNPYTHSADEYGADEPVVEIKPQSISVSTCDYRGTPPFTEITLLLGDCNQPCIGKLNDTWNQEDFDTRQKLLDALYELGYPKSAISVVSDHASLVKSLHSELPQFVFNLCDEGFDNDATKELHVPALLEILGVPYTGAGPNCLAFCYDKGLVNRTSQSIGVKIPRETYYLAEIESSVRNDLEQVHQIIQNYIKYPAFVKPLKGDNSLGITGRSIVRNKTELEKYLAELQNLGIRNVIVQEYLQGTEYGVGMIGNSETGFHFLPIIEVDFTKILDRQLPPILGYESKWDPNSPYWTEISYRRSKLSPQVESYLKNACIALWERFGCRDYARFDFRCDRGRGDGFDGLDGQIKLLEVNPNPGWCWDGKLAYMVKLEGKEYKDLIRMILCAAWQRIYGSNDVILN